MPAILPAIDSFMVTDYLNSVDYQSKGIQVKATRNLSRKSFGFDVQNVKVQKDKKRFTIKAELFSTKKPPVSIKENASFNIEAVIDEKENKIEYCECWECNSRNKKKACTHIEAFITLLHRQSENIEELQIDSSQPAAKRIKMDIKVDEDSTPFLLDSLDLIKKLKDEIKTEPFTSLSNINNNFNKSGKLLKAIVKMERLPEWQANPKEEQFDVEKLVMINLAREFQGSTADDFLDFCTKKMLAMNDLCDTAELLTIEQADTDIWHDLRVGRITASRIHEVTRCSMLRGSLVDKIMGKGGGFSFAMKRGTILEDEVFDVVKEEYVKLKKSGLVLDPNFPFMGASPDGLCDTFVLEIKCPYTIKTHANYIDVNKLSRKYFGQIQLQMHMTHRSKALLAVAAVDFEKTRNITKVWIDYDKEYVTELIEDSLEFWKKAIFPALMRMRTTTKTVKNRKRRK